MQNDVYQLFISKKTILWTMRGSLQSINIAMKQFYRQ